MNVEGQWFDGGYCWTWCKLKHKGTLVQPQLDCVKRIPVFVDFALECETSTTDVGAAHNVWHGSAKTWYTQVRELERLIYNHPQLTLKCIEEKTLRCFADKMQQACSDEVVFSCLLMPYPNVKSPNWKCLFDLLIHVIQVIYVNQQEKTIVCWAPFLTNIVAETACSMTYINVMKFARSLLRCLQLSVSCTDDFASEKVVV